MPTFVFNKTKQNIVKCVCGEDVCGGKYKDRFKRAMGKRFDPFYW